MNSHKKDYHLEPNPLPHRRLLLLTQSRSQLISKLISSPDDQYPLPPINIIITTIHPSPTHATIPLIRRVATDIPPTRPAGRRLSGGGGGGGCCRSVAASRRSRRCRLHPAAAVIGLVVGGTVGPGGGSGGITPASTSAPVGGGAGEEQEEVQKQGQE